MGGISRTLKLCDLLNQPMQRDKIRLEYFNKEY